MLFAQVLLLAVVDCSMGWRIVDKSTSWCSIFSLMADKCTDVATIEELSVFCRWVENGSPVDHFMEILSLKKADAESIYSVLNDWLKMKNVQCHKPVEQIVDVSK